MIKADCGLGLLLAGYSSGYFSSVQLKSPSLAGMLDARDVLQFKVCPGARGVAPVNQPENQSDMTSHLDHGAVPKEAFAALVQWLATTWDTEPDYPGLSNEELGNKRGPVREWLQSLESGDWPRGPREYRVFECDPDMENYYRTISTQTRKCLAIASRALGFRYSAQTMKEGLAFRVAWDDLEKRRIRSGDASDAAASSITRIEWLRIPYQCTFSDLVLLGARSMAEALGITLALREVRPDGDHFEATRIAVDEIEQEGNVNDIHRSTAFVLELAEVTAAAISRHSHLSEYRVVTTGVRGATVSQDDPSIGIGLADAVVACGAASKTCRVAVVASSDTFKANGHQDRVLAFEKCILAAANAGGGVKYTVERIGVDFCEYQHPHELCSRLLDKRSADAVLGHDVIFAESGDVGELLLQLLHFLSPRKIPRVFSADLTPSLFNMMREANTPLEAICGVDPYSYGRLIVRAACDANMQKQIQAKPLRITRSEVREAGTHNYAELMTRNPSLQMNGDEFAWSPWMRDLCPFSREDE